jgi:uncharacterized protein involved in exopolysaccharide biosynthesis
VQIRSATLLQLRGQFEQARITAEVSKVHYGVLDKPEADPKPVNKTYGRNGVFGVIGGLAFATVISLFSERSRRKRQLRMAAPVAYPE